MVDGRKVAALKTYIKTYFAPSIEDTVYFHHIPSEPNITCISRKDLDYYIPKIKDADIDPCHWARTEFNDRFYISYDIEKPISYSDKGKNYLNHYPGPLHKEIKPYNEYSDNAKADVDMMWKHFNEVWCNKKTASSVYLKNWITHMVTGQK